MKILHIVDHSIPLHSGYTFRSRNIFLNQRAMGWQTEHITSPKHVLETGQYIAQETIDDLHFYRANVNQNPLAHLPVLNQFAVISSLKKRLFEIIDTVKPDILHAHSPALNGLAAAAVAIKKSIPLVYEVRAFWEDAAVTHGTCKEGDLRYRLTRSLENKVFKKADAITCICEGLRQDIVGRGYNSNKIFVIPNAVDIAHFTPNTERDKELAQKWQLNKAPVIGFIGSFYAYEGLDLLLQAVVKIKQHQPDIKVLLVGGGSEETKLRALVESLNIQQQVIFTGRVPHQEVQKYYSLIDILVYPRKSSRITELVTPLKPLEAMALQQIFIASDVGGHHELIKEGETGYLFKAGDIEALANKILTVFEHRTDWLKIREAGRHYVETERNWQTSVANYKEVYKSL